MLLDETQISVTEEKNMNQAVVWSKYNCTFCEQAKKLLESKKISFEEKKIGDGYTREDLLEAVPSARTVPQIFLGDKYIGGFQELKEYLEKEGF